MKTLTLANNADGKAATHDYTQSAFRAALHCKCPKCRTGSMFSGEPYDLFGQKMNKNCPHCGFYFEIEPGYFYVAMFVSYALNVALMVTLGIATWLLSGSSNPWVYLGVMLLPMLAVSPLTYRYSRIILLYWLTPGIHFDPEKARKSS